MTSASVRNDDVSIVACPDGPLLVRGEIPIVTPAGEPVPRRRKTVALCRCGASIIKPYCDGTHKLINFRTEPEQPEVRDLSERQQ